MILLIIKKYGTNLTSSLCMDTKTVQEKYSSHKLIDLLITFPEVTIVSTPFNKT